MQTLCNSLLLTLILLLIKIYFIPKLPWLIVLMPLWFLPVFLTGLIITIAVIGLVSKK